MRLDVRWDADVVAWAVAVAEGAGVRPAEVMRRAVALGKPLVAASLRGEETSGAGAPSGGVGSLLGAGTAPPAGPSASFPRPAPAAVPVQKLVVVVARRLAGGAPQPVDIARARRRIELGSVRVDGVVVRDPDALVVAGDVAV